MSIRPRGVRKNHGLVPDGRQASKLGHCDFARWFEFNCPPKTITKSTALVCWGAKRYLQLDLIVRNIIMILFWVVVIIIKV